MKISGFSMVRNGDKLYYPVKEVILSVLPIVDEFVIAIGDCDADDTTLALIESINSPKVKIIHTVWDTYKYPDGMENAHQTDIAKKYCTGDWLFYLQADEVVHEKDHATIIKRCEQMLPDKNVEGLLFTYYHFWGDYNHVHNTHGWYNREIRIIRNDPHIHSYKSAQSFRNIPHFDGLHYRKVKGTYKLKVAAIDAHIYHYGFVRPPDFMLRKSQSLDGIHHGNEASEKMYKSSKTFNYGAIGRIPLFTGTHPLVMQKKILGFNWQEQLNYGKKNNGLSRRKFPHEKSKYFFLSWLENNITGKQIFTAKNYTLLMDK